VSYNDRMRAAARFRMQRRPQAVPEPRELRARCAEVDSRRIPLEGLRRTAAWWREQERIEAEYAERVRRNEQAQAYFAERTQSTATPTSTPFGVYIITIERAGYVNTTFSSNLTGNAYGN